MHKGDQWINILSKYIKKLLFVNNYLLFLLSDCMVDQITRFGKDQFSEDRLAGVQASGDAEDQQKGVGSAFDSFTKSIWVKSRLDPITLSRTLATQTGMTNKWLKDQGLLSAKELRVNIHYPATAR